MSQTRSQLINRALINLGIIATGQSVSTEDVNKMDALVDPTLSELSGLEIYYVDDPGTVGPADGAIDDAAFLSVADYLANRACAAFNLPADTKMQALSLIAEGKLKTLSAPPRNKRFLSVDPAVRQRRRWQTLNDWTNGT